MPVDFATAAGQVRLLINDTTEDPVFSNDEIAAFLLMEVNNVKRAAAQALDTIAADEALTSKVIVTQDLSTNGAQISKELRARATELRKQAVGTLVGTTMAPQGSFPDAPDDTPWR